MAARLGRREGCALCSGEGEDRHRVVEEEGQFWGGLELAIIRDVKKLSSMDYVPAVPPIFWNLN